MSRAPHFAGHCWPRPWAGWRYLPHSSSRPTVGKLLLTLALSGKAPSLSCPPPLFVLAYCVAGMWPVLDAGTLAGKRIERMRGKESKQASKQASTLQAV